jgi:hypothetical protein
MLFELRGQKIKITNVIKIEKKLFERLVMYKLMTN